MGAGILCAHTPGLAQSLSGLLHIHATPALGRTFQKVPIKRRIIRTRVRPACLAVTADRSMEVVKEVAATADPPGG